MAIEINRVDNFSARLYSSFINLTEINSSLYPAVTTTTVYDFITAVNIFDKWGIKTVDSVPAPTPLPTPTPTPTPTPRLKTNDDDLVVTDNFLRIKLQ